MSSVVRRAGSRCCGDDSHESTSSPCFFTTASSFIAMPLGRLVPASHFWNVDSLVLRYRANTGWLTERPQGVADDHPRSRLSWSPAFAIPYPQQQPPRFVAPTATGEGDWFATTTGV